MTAVANGGPVTFTATAGTKSGTATVTVTQAVNAVAVTPPATTLASFGATVQLTATATDANGNVMAGQAVTWQSSNAGVASVNASGLVTAVSNGGPVTFTATAGGKSGTATVTVLQVVNSVVVTPPTTTLASIGATVQLAAAVLDANGQPVAGQTVAWSSSNSAIAMVGPTGLVTAMATGGPVTMTATVGTKTGTATVTVAQTVATVGVTPPATTLGAFGATAQLTATALDGNGIEVVGLPVTWSSSNGLVATVSGTGLVTAVANGGPVTITATVTGHSGTASVTVAQVVNAVTVTPPTTTLTSVGATVQLTAAPVDANGNPVAGQTVSWSSSDVTNTIATISGTGLVTSVGNGGPVTMTATVGAKTGTATVTVAQVVSSVTITTQPSANVQSGIAFPTVPAVTAKDAQGNGVANQLVTVSVASGGALTFTNATATTNVSGVATFSGLSATGLAGIRTLKFTSGAAVSVASSNVTLGAGAPAAVAITTQPSATVQNGVAFPTVPAVTVTDLAGEPGAEPAGDGIGGHRWRADLHQWNSDDQC